MITGTQAISIFPYHTFAQKIAFTAAQGFAVTNRVSEGWLSAFSWDNFSRISGGTTVVDSLTIGKRFVGDGQCWVVTFDHLRKGASDSVVQLLISAASDRIPSEFGKLPERKGPAFEVLDWRSKAPREGSYLRVADPFVWR